LKKNNILLMKNEEMYHLITKPIYNDNLY